MSHNLKSQTGFTLLEVIIAVALAAIVMVSGASLLINAVNTSSRIYARQEQFQSAKISMDFIIEQVKTANGFKLSTYGNGALDTLTLYTPTSSGAEHTYLLKYNMNAKRMEFGGYVTAVGTQELAPYIENITVTVDADAKIMYITVITTGYVTGYMEADTEPLILRGSVSVKHKRME